MRLLSVILLVGFVAPAFASDNSSTDLRYRSYRKWAINLPAEKWFAVNDGIKINHAGGDKFAAKVEGERLQFDTNGDGKIDRTIKALVDADTKVSTSRVVLSGKTTDGKPLKYAVRLRKDAAGWEWAPGGAMVGTITTKSGAIPVRLIDQNGNGRFDDFGKDAMTIGASNEATFLSKTILTGNQLHQLAIAGNGTQLATKAFAGKTGKLDLATAFDSKAKLLAAIVQSADGVHSFDLANGTDTVTVPVGIYRIVSGLVGLGNQRARVRKGRMKPIKVTTEKSQKLEWGGPIKAEFAFARASGKVVFSPDQIWYYGKAGEEYTGWAPCGKSPEFQVRDKDTGAVIEVAILPGSC